MAQGNALVAVEAKACTHAAYRNSDDGSYRHSRRFYGCDAGRSCRRHERANTRTAVTLRPIPVGAHAARGTSCESVDWEPP